MLCAARINLSSVCMRKWRCANSASGMSRLRRRFHQWEAEEPAVVEPKPAGLAPIWARSSTGCRPMPAALAGRPAYPRPFQIAPSLSTNPSSGPCRPIPQYRDALSVRRSGVAVDPPSEMGSVGDPLLHRGLGVAARGEQEADFVLEITRGFRRRDDLDGQVGAAGEIIFSCCAARPVETE